MQPESSAPLDPAVPELIAHLMQANYNDYADVTQAVIEGQQRTIAHLEATLNLIRGRMNELFAGDYMPTQHAIEMAVFHPRPSKIEVEMERLLAERAQQTS
jgi:putative methionine-R-sulfoxide reductase with GAF domain